MVPTLGAEYRDDAEADGLAQAHSYLLLANCAPADPSTACKIAANDPAGAEVHAGLPAASWNGRFPQLNPERNHRGTALPVRAGGAADLAWLDRDCRLAGKAVAEHDVIVALDAPAWDDK